MKKEVRLIPHSVKIMWFGEKKSFMEWYDSQSLEIHN